MPPLLILASASPRRRELLAGLGVPFEVMPAEVVEHESPDSDPREMVRHNAALKAEWVAARRPEALVLGVDTTVFLDGVVLNKPRDVAAARAMLGRLSGCTHTVYTGLAVRRQRDRLAIDEGVASEVTGPYEHITWLRGAGCDTTLFGDTDGKTYAFIPRGNIDVQEVDLKEMKLIGKPQRIVTADNADIGIAAKPDYLEGPWVEKIGAKYCLFYAEIYRDKNFPDWLGYWTGVAYADHPLGPWTKDPRGKIFLGGHLAVFDGPDNRKWFSYRGEGHDPAHGKLCIAPVNLE